MPASQHRELLVLEPTLTVLAAVVILLSQASYHTTPLGWAAVVLFLAGGALSGTRPMLAVGLSLVGLLLSFLVPPDLFTTGPLALHVTVFSLVGRRRRHGVPIGLVLAVGSYLALNVLPEGYPPTLMGSALTVVLFGAAFLWRVMADRVRSERQRSAEQLAGLRAELARDLHDTVAQTLSHSAMQAWMAADEPDVPDRVRATLERIATQSSTSAADLRQLLSTLREDAPPSSPALGPLANADTLRAEVAEQEARLREEGFVPEVTLELTQLSAARSTTLAKALREAVNNMLKHAPPGSRCVVSLVERDDLVVGTFANPAPARRRRSVPGLGIIGMEERLRLLKGTLDVSVEDGWWTTTITLPRS